MLSHILPKSWRRVPAGMPALPAARAAGPRAEPVQAAALRRSFEQNGYLILPGFFPQSLMVQLTEHLDTLWATRADRPRVVIDSHYGQPNEERTHFRSVADDVRQHPYKLLDLHLEEGLVREVCTAVPLLEILRELLGANPIVCNSLLFEKGSQQDAHFDTFFMASKTRNMMAASWIAIDPVTEASGPLYYYPRSHLIDPYLFSHGKMNAIFAELETGAASHIERIIADHGLTREIFLPQQGDVLIWHAQLLHGGSEIVDPQATRRSLVTHYWTDIDYPDDAQRLDLGDRRWILKREPQHVVDRESLAEVDAFLATLTVSEALRAGVPPLFDPRLYLARNQDVLRARVDPWRHYMEHGREEGRIW